MALQIDFEWYRDEDGYDLLPAGPPDPTVPKGTVFMFQMDARVTRFGPGGAVQETQQTTQPSHKKKPPPFERIARRGGRLISIRPLDIPDLYLLFARSARTKEGLLDFVRQYGPLTGAGNGQYGEAIRPGLLQSARMHELLNCPHESRAEILRRYGKDGFPCAFPEVFLTADPLTNSPQIRYRVLALSQALWLGFADAMSSGVNLRPCDFCGNWFKVGPGTGRREDARFCSDAHRIAYHVKKRSKMSAEKSR